MKSSRRSQQEEMRTAARRYRAVLESNPSDAEALQSLSEMLLERGADRDAVALYRNAIASGSDSVVIQNQLGELWLKLRRPTEAAVCFRAAIKHDGNCASAHNNLGRALNNLGQLEAATQAFKKALLLEPDFAKAQVNVGHVLRRKGNLPEAINAFERAVQIDPYLLSAHRNLGITLMIAEEAGRAALCFKTCIELAPDDVDSWINLGIAEHALFNMDNACDAYQTAIRLSPEETRAHMNLGLVYVELRRTQEAERELKRALELSPDDPDVLAELAALYEESNRLEQADTMAQRGLCADPGHPRLRLEAAKCDRRFGRVEQGIERLTAVDLTSLPPRLLQQMHYELGNLYDRGKRPDDAYQHFASANRLASQNWRARRVDPARYLALLDKLYSFFEKSDPSSWPGTPEHAGPTPVFLVGFPRSGTTLLELVLDSHPRLQTLEEKPTINCVIEELEKTAAGYPAALATLTADNIHDLRQSYFDVVNRFVARKPGTLLIDKLPIRTAHVGLIWRLFPNAKVVFAARHPCDVILSGFMQNYLMNDAFANFFTMADAVRVYDKVMCLWALYADNLPLRVQINRYEDLVDDLESSARAVLAFLDVEWNESVVSYVDRARERGRINTNSYHQVTEPIYRRARYRWRSYQSFFEPFMETLAPHIQRFGYGDIPG